MFPWYHGSQMYKELPDDDRVAIQQIYGKKLKRNDKILISGLNCKW